MKRVNWKKLILAIILCQFTGVIGSIATMPSIPTWYASLIKPSFNPPSWVFGPVWTILFTMMGISLYLIWQKGINKKEVKEAVKFFYLQLVFNCFWSIIFFGLHNPFAAFIEIIILLVLVAFVIFKFYKINKNAAFLLIPYLLWGSFATFLTYNIWLLNK
jgi:tryptophan-rich sensory protein